MGGFKLILGTPIQAVPRPWLHLPIEGVMVNAYEILNYGLSKVRGRGLRKLLGLDKTDIELWIDSGGYQFLSRGVNPGVDKIAKVYREVDADFYIGLDFPPGPRDDSRTRAMKIAKTVSSFMSLKNMLRGLVEEGRLIPVFHMAVGESLRLQLRIYESHSITAAVGGLIPHIMQLSGKGSRLKAVIFLMLLRKLWRGKLHALGLASAAMIPLLKAIGIDSGDTQTWRHKAAYGKIIIPSMGERHISGRRVRFGPAVLKPNELPVFEHYVKKVSSILGTEISPMLLSQNFEARALFNAYVLLEMANNGAVYRGPSKAFLKLFERIEQFKKMSASELESELAKLLALQEELVNEYRTVKTVSDVSTGVLSAEIEARSQT
ncbi:tRNA guanosine transglycosylase family protein [Pyrofollis japonicus]|uniref:hypothetical protein n=1 Tax=Pyrofollis japonicus TaxID=3060460 RepID=UPI00295BB08F|nr:hypothetical protein [Pyrofollis japonicus]